MKNLLEIKNLSLDFLTLENRVQALKNISFGINRGQTLGLVGESGSGKSVTALSIMRLLHFPPAHIKSGEIFFEKKDLLKLSGPEMRKIRGNHISMIFQEPMTSLNPVFTVGYQIVEVLRLHQKLGRKESWKKATDLLDKVGIKNPLSRVKSYPHEMSGGQRQRVMIAMAMACEPDLLIADEPTTALDVTIQKQILELMVSLQNQYNMSLLFITHDLGVIRSIADHILVMHKGQVVEEEVASSLFKKPKHPYTRGLLACRPSLNESYRRLATIHDFMDERGRARDFDKAQLGFREDCPLDPKENPLLEVKNLKKYYPVKSGLFGKVKTWIKAVDDVSLSIHRGRTLGLVGESGCGKTTLGKSLLRLIQPSSGKVFYGGEDLGTLNSRQMRQMRRKMQIVFQDPYASLNPRMTVGSAIMEPMVVHKLGDSKKDRFDKTVFLMEKVGLTGDCFNRYPHEFSGGQRQRVCIARALAVEPEFIICDESVSALDVSIQAQILNLLMDLKEEMKLTYIFISHDLAVVKFISDEVAVMNQGKIVEMAKASQIYDNPGSGYTKKLLDSVLH